MNKNNNLKYEEKPYCTLEERKMYAKIAMDEALKEGNYQVANHYKILLKAYESIGDNIAKGFINHMKKSK